MRVQGLLLQLAAIAAAGFFFFKYCDAGRTLLNSWSMTLEGLQIQMLDHILTAGAAGTIVFGSSDFPYPHNQAEFQKFVLKEYPSRGAAAYTDRWGTALYYCAFVHQGRPGFCIWSAGPDKKWCTKDDLWLWRCGDYTKSQNLGWFAQSMPGAASGGMPAAPGASPSSNAPRPQQMY